MGVFALAACQLKPTRVYEGADPRFSKDLVENLSSRAQSQIEIAESTVVVDARGAFDHALAKIPGSVNVQWQEFTNSRSKYPGKLKKDRYRLARRLARIGIRPDTHVVVVGKGPQGQGEEGRVAWTLATLGVRNIDFASLSYFEGIRLVSKDKSPPRKAKTLWRPAVNESIEAKRNELLDVVTGKSLRRGDRVYIIDVRSKEEYFSKSSFGGNYESPNIESVHIPWTEFFDGEGRPNLSLTDQLKGVGITPESRVIVLSNKGVRSAAVTMALLSMGYRQAANFPGGFRELVAGR